MRRTAVKLGSSLTMRRRAEKLPDVARRSSTGAGGGAGTGAGANDPGRQPHRGRQPGAGAPPGALHRGNDRRDPGLDDMFRHASAARAATRYTATGRFRARPVRRHTWSRRRRAPRTPPSPRAQTQTSAARRPGVPAPARCEAAETAAARRRAPSVRALRRAAPECDAGIRRRRAADRGSARAPQGPSRRRRHGGRTAAARHLAASRPGTPATAGRGRTAAARSRHPARARRSRAWRSASRPAARVQSARARHRVHSRAAPTTAGTSWRIRQRAALMSICRRRSCATRRMSESRVPSR